MSTRTTRLQRGTQKRVPAASCSSVERPSTSTLRSMPLAQDSRLATPLAQTATAATAPGALTARTGMAARVAAASSVEAVAQVATPPTTEPGHKTSSSTHRLAAVARLTLQALALPTATAKVSLRPAATPIVSVMAAAQIRTL